MTEVVIVDAVRTPMGRSRGGAVGRVVRVVDPLPLRVGQPAPEAHPVRAVEDAEGGARAVVGLHRHQRHRGPRQAVQRHLLRAGEVADAAAVAGVLRAHRPRDVLALHGVQVQPELHPVVVHPRRVAVLRAEAAGGRERHLQHHISGGALVLPSSGGGDRGPRSLRDRRGAARRRAPSRRRASSAASRRSSARPCAARAALPSRTRTAR